MHLLTSLLWFLVLIYASKWYIKEVNEALFMLIYSNSFVHSFIKQVLEYLHLLGITALGKIQNSC